MTVHALVAAAEEEVRPRWRRKPNARPEEVLEAALDLFIARGFAATRMEDVAAAAGLSKAAVYLYFPSKDALFQELLNTRLVPIRAHLQAAADAAGTNPVLALRALVIAWTEVMSNERLAAIPRIVMGEAARFPNMARFYHDEITERVTELVCGLVTEGMRQGLLRPVEPRATARALLAPLVLEVWRRQIFNGMDPPPKPARQVADEVFDLFYHGVAQQDAAPELKQ